MLDSDKLKLEIDNIPEEYYGIIWDMLKTLDIKSKYITKTKTDTNKSNKKWSKFISETYGSFAEVPIERGEQGTFEFRENLI